MRAHQALAATTCTMTLTFIALTPAASITTRATSSTAPPLTPATKTQACTLLSTDDIHAALGGTVSAGELTTAPEGDETICQWTITTSNHSGGYSAQLDVKTPYSSSEFKQQRKIASGSAHTVKHLGDTAFSERAKEGGQVYDDLWVRTNDLAFRLEVLKDLGAKPLERLARIVRTNLARAPNS